MSVDENHPAAAFMKINDAVGDFNTIQRMVRQGFIVRTRADSGTKQSRTNEIELNFSGSDQLESDVSIVLNETLGRGPDISLARAGIDHVRIANLNTLYQGLADSRRSGAIKRLLAATEADIFCFEEETEEDRFREAAPRMVPANDGRDLNLHWSDGCAIAASLPLEPVAMVLDRGAAGLIELPTGAHLAVVSVHFKCCGYSGSWEDETRIRQAEQLVGEIQRLRSGEFGEKAKDAAVDGGSPSVTQGLYSDAQPTSRPTGNCLSPPLSHFALHSLYTSRNRLKSAGD